MSITQHNYEQYFIDYHEGSLSADERSELMTFLAANPDLKKELGEYEEEPLSPDLEVTFTNKTLLKKNDFSVVSKKEEKIIAYAEGDLSEEEKHDIQQEIGEDEQSGKVYAQFQAAILTPDHSIEFPFKSKLKKKAVVIIPFNRLTGYAAAAVIIILIGLSGLFIFNSGGTIERDQYVLGNLDKHQLNFIDNDQASIEPSARKPVAINTQIFLRENIKLAKMPSGKTPEVVAFSSYYNPNLALSMRIVYPLDQFTVESESPALAEVQKDKTMVGRIFSGIFGKVKEPFEDGRKDDKNTDSGNFSLWNIAKLGVKGVNALGDHEYTLVREYNDKGNVKGLILLEE